MLEIPQATNLQVFLPQIRPNLFKTLKGKLASSFSLQFRYLGFAYSICAACDVDSAMSILEVINDTLSSFILASMQYLIASDIERF